MATREMTDEAVRAAAARRVAEAVGYLDSTLSAQREQALKYYRGDPFGNEVEGRSQVVTREVAQHVDGQLPQLMRVFAAGDEVVRFQPSEPGDEAGADQATDYCNWVWDQNEGFTLFHTWFKDALLFKLGVVKIWWDEAVEVTRERYVGLTDAQLAAIQGDADIEVGEVTTEQAVAPGPDGALALTNAHDVLVTRRNKRGRVRIAPVPPEEFLFGRRAKSDRDADILAHRRRMSISDLIAMGYDPRFPAAAEFAYRKKAGRREYVRVSLAPGDPLPLARKFPREGAGLLSSLTGSHGFAELAEETVAVAPGDRLTVLPFAALF